MSEPTPGFLDWVIAGEEANLRAYAQRVDSMTDMLKFLGVDDVEVDDTEPFIIKFTCDGEPLVALAMAGHVALYTGWDADSIDEPRKVKCAVTLTPKDWGTPLAQCLMYGGYI